MMNSTSTYPGYRYPSQIISHAVWLYHRFTLSYRNIEEILAARGLVVSYETIRNWCTKFGPSYSRENRKLRGAMNDTWYMDEVFIKINGVLHYLWRAVDENGDEIDILIQKRKDKRAAIRFFKKLLKGQGSAPKRIVTDRLRSYAAAKAELMPGVEHSMEQYENNRCELSHQPGRQKERQMRRFKSQGQAQRFLSCQGTINALFRYPRSNMNASHYRYFRDKAFSEWHQASCVQNLN